MATIKSYTDIEQSKKLAEILPFESADMYWDYDYSIFTGKYKYYPKVMDDQFDDVCIPCWSLAALIETLPNRINIFHSASGNCIIDGVLYDNFVDACVTMIEKLHELKML